MSLERFHSFHIFFFPFKWDDSSDIPSGNENMMGFERALNSHTSLWKRSKNSWFPIEHLVHYNERVYFYDFVWKAIYDEGTDDSFIQHYGLSVNSKLQYYINVRGREYELEIDDVLLHVYATGVGVVSFHLYNRREDQSSKEDILTINQFGRRLYPPFYSTELSKLGTREFDEDADWTSALARTKSIELAVELRIENAGKIIAKDDFSEYKPGSIPGLIQQLLRPGLVQAMKIKPTGDDRMFVLCWYGNNALVNELKQYNSYKSSDWWYQYIFVDGGFRTCWDDQMMRTLIKKHTNSRWVQQGTLYGTSRYSFVAVTAPISNFGLIASHMRSMYYKIVELCLIQRTSLLRFSEQVAEISTLEPEKGLALRVSGLYKRYIHFVNKVYFREVTGQEQGIELYNLLSKHMCIERDVHNLDGEIHELHEYAMLHEERRRTRAIDRLTILGSAFLVPAFIAGYYGMNVFDSGHAKPTLWQNFVLLISIVICTLLLISCVRQRAITSLRIVTILGFIVALSIVILLLPFWLFQ